MSEILIQVWDGAHEFVFLIKLLGDSDVDGPPPRPGLSTSVQTLGNFLVTLWLLKTVNVSTVQNIKFSNQDNVSRWVQ